MLGLLISLACFAQSKKPKYNVEIVSHPDDMPKDQEMINIPGYQGTTLLCAVPSSPEVPKDDGDPSELLMPYIGRCASIYADEDELYVCFEGQSTYNQIPLGYHSGYEYKDGRYFSYTEKGAKCGQNSTWSLVTEYVCDYGVSKEGVSIPAFWKSDPCTIQIVMKTPFLCKHVNFSSDSVLNIKCIPKDIYEKEEIRNLL